MNHAIRLVLKSSIAILPAIAAGCADEIRDYDDKTADNETQVRQILDSASINAVLAEHALYPYHFNANDAALNDLGEERLEILASAYKTAPGPLVIIQGDCPDALHRDRVQCAVQWLQSAGVDVAKVPISSSLPGGPGIPSSSAVQALDNTRALNPNSAPSTPAGFMPAISPKGDR
jgi:hypothetical protein